MMRDHAKSVQKRSGWQQKFFWGLVICFASMAAAWATPPPVCKLQVCFINQQAKDAYECDNGCVFEKDPLEVDSTVHDNLIEYEGKAFNLYLDTANKVTVGIGHMLPTAGDAQDLTFYKVLLDGSERKANDSEIKDAFDIIREHQQPKSCTNPTEGKALKCHTAGYYGKLTKIHMHSDDIEALAHADLVEFGKELHTVYPDFDTYPTRVQVALYDMIFNLGQTKLTKEFPHFTAAIRARDWQKAADESHRRGIVDSRNDYVKGLLDDAAAEGKEMEKTLAKCPSGRK